MRILVDADSCPVVSIVEKKAKKYEIPVVLLCDTNHELNQIGIKIDMYRQEYRFTPAFAFIQAV